MSALPTRCATWLASVAVLAMMLAACGGSVTGTVAQQAQSIASSAASQAEGKLKDITTKAAGTKTATAAADTATATDAADTKTATTSGDTSSAQPGKTTATTKTETETRTEPGKTSTFTKTKTESAPSPTTSVNNSTVNNSAHVAVHPTTTTTGSDEGLPWWGWVLIALGAITIAIATFLFGRHRGSQPASAGADGRGDGPPGPGGPPAPPGGPPGPPAP